ncbi:MAG: aldo/keto reductase [Tannerellaceae bacterium]|nr:aldo/keto reductase [Tannerellaceae bacterium]
MKEYNLSNGIVIPGIGFGTWQIPEGAEVRESVKQAIEYGYRHIDTAAIYGNEKGVGEGIAQSDVPREELFVTTKVWNTDRGYDKTLRAFDASLEKLGLNYVDLYLIHWPARGEEGKEINLQTWEAMQTIYREGRAKAIGVSNFLKHHLQHLIDNSEIVPMVDQIEYHPGYRQEETVRFCRENNILVEAWSPLGSGKMLQNETLKEIASHYNKSVAQLCIRWCLQNETLPLPKSVNRERIRQNLDVFDFVIADNDMQQINELSYIGGSGLHPDKVTF